MKPIAAVAPIQETAYFGFTDDSAKQLFVIKCWGSSQRREIQIKDVDGGLGDFPAIIGGKEVFLCWEQDEKDIEFWHDFGGH